MYKENYNIDFQQAKQMKEYKFNKSIEFEEFKKQIKNNNYNLNESIPFQIEFGNICIEFNIYGIDDYSYYICIQYENGWDSYDYSKTPVNLEVEDLEESMFDILMKEAKENNLYWSIYNE